ncbi:hypothetical protein EOA22_01590 [Mesorhizobium sp. M7A.F.Ca.US.014.04.1.1]|uniref:hypothetical protein n=1 Tax=Mesorhizobium TaxID=68287 RepID=UPI000FCBDC02|nr:MULTISPECIES: hypothetical protein [Mesorhizobium]RUU17230.1 hypothetical protein EOC84_25355 [Mesorhizobium sp. Primo-B]RUU35652.1 hypothetical protein EOC83_25555 [Mesorhizobium sp. Primo-A]RUX15026.1 hypothetical protein EN996_14385 [Mesorhizobium sp. M7A.F.Ca.CA.002.14.1.2]RUX38999.1 hypothetical protein EN987_13545 [Mesorhizobium sp. M7A.F.Ca.CA.002.11.2.1]RUX54403.1 hypothetical protein EN989_29465 [Mesorhizobium sp. M7A.F.Ca.CA.002.12.1.1]RUX58090.1 hypothetical protein EN994_07015 
MAAIADYISEIISFLVGLGAGSLITFQIIKNRAGPGGNAVNQGGATAGGDLVGRDKTITK